MNAPHISRRTFNAGLGGIVLSFSMGPQLALGQDKQKLPGSLDMNRMLNAWLRIDPDGPTRCVGLETEPVQQLA